MKKRFPKLLLALSCMLLISVWGCTNEEFDPPVNSPEERVQTPPKSLEDAVYHEATESWIVPQKDPYTLTNFQRAYDNLLSGRSSRALTRAQTAELSAAEPLQATHYSLKIYPKDEHEQWKVELMEDVKVAYIPFDHVQLTKAQVEELPATTRSAAIVYPEKNEHLLVYDDLETIEGPVAPQTHILPILYVVWPCDKPLPQGLDYEIDYEVFLPPRDSDGTRSSASTLSETSLQLIEDEAISLALGIPAPDRTATRGLVKRVFSGNIYMYDEYLDELLPLGNVKQRFQLGSAIWDVYTDHENGYFSITLAVSDAASYTHIYQHPKWKITTDSSTAPISDYCGTVGDRWPPLSSSKDRLAMGVWLPDAVCEINCAVDYYYNGYHFILTSGYKEGIRIIASGKSNSSVNGSFYYSLYNPVYIKIYNNGNSPNRVIGTVLHELGHSTHYVARSGFWKYNAVHKLVAESYASYVGWYLGRVYYQYRGWSEHDPTDGYDITLAQARQGWTKTNVGTLGPYSPLFVDLQDRYNQNYYQRNSYNYDPISDVPHSVIRAMAVECTDWASVKRKLQQYVGVYYDQADLDAFVAPYDYWFANN